MTYRIRMSDKFLRICAPFSVIWRWPLSDTSHDIRHARNRIFLPSSAILTKPKSFCDRGSFPCFSLLHRIHLDPWTAFSSVSSSLQIAIASITAHTIWRGHWESVFDNFPFLLNVVTAKAVTSIHRSHNLNTT
ncbi:hypothetical protein PHYBLDRAFT_144658 [Phycomyces blakesleeanus NRRL 1555(-)]|uniref:Uncharacterized protein n=1 Tax=Phycomyces blakesleeanus (strain ATCC 8743b / DSM 1359 / FGSC 10004 / NBRC 33097 / NRRL 1555) TaxID=763407 RepID=A0A163AKV4_PHYB8|nr:hypothetical protein PHYBLDRAFT_144658 [Phycomyces blakesleeanus NRRL 1555(-)]OAD74201.1 hypothetical protein PHYBLDRAFT_144658 [Phycomyces blakesleeanus NRRL 1555(-)]|eukprot:XP_018292241.1 hypothetical protein PHYBLDRAFT_144658 [Phycomyces blakesleeanus NRRL 1555(-)]